MFTGIIQEVGAIKLIQKKGHGLTIQIGAPDTSKSLKKGGSVSINGACQTAVIVDRDWFEVFATSETVNRTCFQYYQAGMQVNLELPMTLNDPLGGHLVAGHIDDTGRIISIEPELQSTIMKIAFKPGYYKYIIEKGSIAIDGISLTVFDIQADSFSVSLIPETISWTNLKFKQIGDLVNLEFDQIGKYIEKFISANKKGLTMDDLIKHGFMR